jgi:hypothetical protein
MIEDDGIVICPSANCTRKATAPLASRPLSPRPGSLIPAFITPPAAPPSDPSAPPPTPAGSSPPLQPPAASSPPASGCRTSPAASSPCSATRNRATPRSSRCNAVKSDPGLTLNTRGAPLALATRNRSSTVDPTSRASPYYAQRATGHPRPAAREPTPTCFDSNHEL